MRTLVMRAANGDLLPLNPSRWYGASTVAEARLFADLAAPVLDVGCGPGRIVEGLARGGVAALGVDPSPAAVALARRRGCLVLQRSIFQRLPGEGRWGSALLLDGNVGIGGDPPRLLRRCRELIGEGGAVVAELEPPGTGWRSCRARLERGPEVGAWFGWSVVGVDAIDELATAGGLNVGSVWSSGDQRWFARLTPRPRRVDGGT
jgi:SAM-dependent methyltransferase